jgi:hypothetical protein
MRGLSNNRAGRRTTLGFLAIIFIAGCSYNTIESGMTEWDYKMYHEGWQLEHIDNSEDMRWVNGTD